MRALMMAMMVLMGVATLANAGNFGKYGVSAQVPQGFAIQSPPGNYDGRRFVDRNGAEIRVWGGWRIENITGDESGMRDYYQEIGGVVTYDARGNGWYVLSGYFGQSIFYLRVENGMTCEGEEARASLEFIYPEDSRAAYDPLVGLLAKSLGFGPC
ncbi:hypothetical protein [uncultured Pelagimonas sp.]|uniref:hypothetical protein n=1 Tax=uncultured Pelagimonas sp. TaxID=1618102 RepID=UPI002624B9A4|nr:hypothetical protein [uncultured Pelagimonas sp.]